MISVESLSEASLVIGVWTGVIVLSIAYIVVRLLFHQPSLPDVSQ